MSNESFFMTLATVADHRRDLARLGSQRHTEVHARSLRSATRRARARKRAR